MTSSWITAQEKYLMELMVSSQYLFTSKCMTCSTMPTENEDFGKSSGSIRFVPGEETSQQISIPINDDRDVESNEPLVIDFTSESLPPGMQTLPTPNITIIDNDISEGTTLNFPQLN